ncbi:MAG: hypothetical protein ACK5GN_12805 [Pseudomonadota bacterium]|jgi:hypothetical protein
MSIQDNKTWVEIGGVDCVALERELSARTAALISQGRMPANEVERLAKLSTAISSGAFVVTAERLELLRGLCHLYSAGIRAEKITSHRPYIGPIIVRTKKAIFRVLSALLGPSFQFQRDFNAGVIRLLGDLCNEDKKRQ